MAEECDEFDLETSDLVEDLGCALDCVRCRDHWFVWGMCNYRGRYHMLGTARNPVS